MSIDFRKILTTSKEPGVALSNAIVQASAVRTSTPPVESGDYAKLGPNGNQGVVHISRDPNSAPGAGANKLVFKSEAKMKSNVRIECEAGVTIAFGLSRNGQILSFDGVKNVTFAGIPDSSGNVFVYDARSGGAPDSVNSRRFINMGDVQFFLLEHYHSIQHLGAKGAVVSGSAVHPWHGANVNVCPRDGIYRHHSNEGSPSGYGPNQIASAARVAVTDLTSNGGTVLRIETDGNACGVHGMIARRLKGSNGNRVVALSCHDANSENVDIRVIDGVSMFEGIRLNQQQGTGRLSNVYIADGTFIAGKTAQDPSKGGIDGNNPSHSVINANGKGATIKDIGYKGFTNPGSWRNPDGSSPYNMNKQVPR